MRADQQQVGAWWQSDLAKQAVVILPLLLGSGYIGVEHVAAVNNTDDMLEQHTEVLKQRVDYMEDWIIKHKQQHMDD